MGQTGSSHKRRRTLFGRDFDKFENQVREDSDYVTLVRVIPSANELSPTISDGIERRAFRSTSTLPDITISRPKTTLEPNIYSDLKDYLRPKSTLLFSNDIPIDEDFDENILPPMVSSPTLRPVSFANHCSSRCVCSDCRLTRYHLLNWLLPNCTRTNAERLLMGRPDGTFLVRKSEKFPNQYTLSFMCGAVIRHCLILRSVYGFGLKEPYKYPTLQQFVLHYAKHSLSEFNWKLNTTLKYPVFA